MSTINSCCTIYPGVELWREETGIAASTEGITPYDVSNGLDNTLVIAQSEEPIKLGFPLHNLLVRRYFADCHTL